MKTDGTDGYDAVQVTFGKRKLTRVTGAARGHFAGQYRGRNQDGRVRSAAKPSRSSDSQSRLPTCFKVGDLVDVTAASKGHGYVGVIKRHHFSGFPGSHGTHEYFRHGGSIGNRSYPGRVRKGMRMAGQMGNVTASILNLEVIDSTCRRQRGGDFGRVPGPTARSSSSIMRRARGALKS